jgi:hypothetical protein
LIGPVAAALCALGCFGGLLGPVRAPAQPSEPVPDLNAVIDESDKPVQVVRNKTVDPADVAEGCATKVDFAAATVESVTAFTTGSATAELLNPRSGSLGGGLPLARTGRPFDCANWGEDGPGILVVPQIGYAHPIAGDVANIVQIDD